MIDYKEIDDNELTSLICENDENVKDIIFAKYSYIIDILIKKYTRLIKALQIDEQEIRCEASYGFSDGINSYSDNKNASLKTFLTICIERRITKYLNKFTTQKAQILNETLSLNYTNEENATPLIDLISDESKFDPLNNLTSVETFEEIINTAKNNLSKSEYEVFCYMINEVPYQEIAKILSKTPKQIDNTIQRIKGKLRKNIKVEI